jgi:N-acetylglucosamine-6-sulfatase
VAILCILAMAAPGTAARSTEPLAPKADGAAPARPNIVLVLTDDLDVKLGTLEMVPGFKALFRDQGITFSNSFVSESLCCPSRATIQRGQWVHNHQVVGNKAPEGGFEKFHALKEDQSTVGTWLRAAGYRTGFMGKYLNGYPDTADPTFVPPGWDEWDSPAKGNAYGEYNYTLNENGSLVRYGNQPEDYLTDVLSRKATRFVKQAGGERRPFFLVVATYAPHQPATPAPRHADAFGGVSAPRPSSYNEEDVSDKPEWIRNKPLLNRRQQLQMDHLYRKRLQSMLAVKELIEQLLTTLRGSGQLDNSYIFFASDNGFHLGEHRLHAGKLTAYEEDIKVPLYVRGPGVPARTVREEMVGNVDLAPTFAELAHATVPDFVDGRSLVPLLHGGPRPEPWRGAFLVEQEEVHFGRGKAERPRQVLEPLDLQEEEMANAPPHQGPRGVPAYNALRTTTHTYVAYSTGEHELYDLHADPHELTNIAATADKALLASLDSWLEAFRKCHGADCRTADVAPPR